MNFSSFLSKAKQTTLELIGFTAKAVEVAAPIAAVVGTATGDPEVTAAANLANGVAHATDKIVSEADKT